MAATAPEKIVPRMLLLDGCYVGSDLVVVGERGTILRSPDEAKTWQIVPSPTTAPLTAVAFASDAMHGWVVGHDAIILATSDAGRSWSKQYQGENLTESFLDVIALDAQRVIAVGAYGLFLSTTDGGAHWTRRKLTEDDYHFNRISRGPAGALFIAGEHGTLFRSIDASASWTKLTTAYDGSFYGVLAIGDRTLIAHGLRGRVFRSSDDGATWGNIATPRPALLATAVQMPNRAIVFAGQGRTLFLSRDDGHTVGDAGAAPTSAIAELIVLKNGSLLGLGEAGTTVLGAP